MVKNFFRLVLVPQLTSRACLHDTQSHIKQLLERSVQKWLSGYDLSNTAVPVCENVIGVGANRERKYGHDELNLLQIFDPTCTANCICVEHKRAVLYGKSYCTEAYGRELKTNSYTVLLKNGSIASIQSILSEPQKQSMHLICKMYAVCNQPFILKNFDVLNYRKVKSTNTIVAVVYLVTFVTKFYFLAVIVRIATWLHYNLIHMNVTKNKVYCKAFNYMIYVDYYLHACLHYIHK